tara:strand:- start:1493 stop:1711 length:219 start_codon:yes stop_codon:yes gene_type:complete
MKKYNLLVEIKIDEERIEDLYPDYEIYFESLEEFLQTIYSQIETEDGALNTLGYSVVVKENATILPITFSEN